MVSQRAVYGDMVAMLPLEDASHEHLLRIGQSLSGTNLLVPVTSALLYTPLQHVLNAPPKKTPLSDVLQFLQHFGHMYRGTFDDTPHTIDHLNRNQLNDVFATLKTNYVRDDDQATSLSLVKDFLGSLLGLDSRPQVSIEPRHLQAYDQILLPHKAGMGHSAKILLTEMLKADRTFRPSVLFSADLPIAVGPSACPGCASRLQRIYGSNFASDPNERITTSALPVCGECLNQARQHLLGGSSFLFSPPVVNWHNALSYSDVFQKSSQESFRRGERLLDQMHYHRLRSVEFQARQSRGSLLWYEDAPAGDWFVYHYSTLTEWTEFHKLTEAMNSLWQFHLLNPDHEVVTVFLNVVDNFGGSAAAAKFGHTPKDLDALITRQFGTTVYTPAQLKGSNASVQAAVANGWPSLGALAGKFIFVVVAGADHYAPSAEAAVDRQAFVSGVNVTSEDEMREKNWIVFFDQAGGPRQLSMCTDIQKAHFISRQHVNTELEFQRAINQKTHHLSTARINFHYDPWSRTHTSKGFPFLPFREGDHGFDADSALENQRYISMRATSYDIWGKEDGAVFSYREDPTPNNEWVEYTFFVSNANSHVNKWARAGMCLRAHPKDPGAINFTLVRPARVNLPARVQVRKDRDGATREYPSKDHDSYLYKLRAKYSDANTTECEAYESRDNGGRWDLIHVEVVPARLKYHGLIGTSQGNVHNQDGTQYQFLFGNVSLNNKPIVTRDFPNLEAIGVVYFNPVVVDGLDEKVKGA